MNEQTRVSSICHIVNQHRANCLVSNCISSYRKCYSCETALLQLTKDWRKMQDNVKLVVVVAMDLSKALDVIQHDLLAKPNAYGVEEKSGALLRTIYWEDNK